MNKFLIFFILNSFLCMSQALVASTPTKLTSRPKKSRTSWLNQRSLVQQRLVGELPLQGEIHCSSAEGCRLGLQDQIALSLDMPSFFRSHLYQHKWPGLWHYHAFGIGVQVSRGEYLPISLALTTETYQARHRNSVQDQWKKSGFKNKLKVNMIWNSKLSSFLSAEWLTGTLKGSHWSEKQLLKNYREIETLSLMLSDLAPVYRVSLLQEWSLYSEMIPSEIWPSYYKISLMGGPSIQYMKFNIPKTYEYREHEFGLTLGGLLNIESMADTIGHWGGFVSSSLHVHFMKGIERGPHVIQNRPILTSQFHFGVNYKFF